ncbi:MAG: hypothetical protein JWO80_297 [Bryobacterales bacterium]|nr:hypothetical protein [Bryobacterales bacterium]
MTPMLFRVTLFPALCYSGLTLLLAGSAFPQCEPSKAIKESLDADAAANRPQQSDAEKRAARRQILDKALATDPTDYFLLQRKRDLLDENSSTSRQASLTYFSSLYDRYPNSPAVIAVYAQLLREKDAPKALGLLDASQKAHPDFPWTEFQKIFIFDSGTLRNKERLSAEIDAFLRICPAPASPTVYLVLSRNGTAEQSARHAAALRKRLEAESGTPNQALWRALWDLEFKAVPPGEHAAVRDRIAKDLAKLDSEPHPGRLSWLSFMVAGYANVGNPAAIDKLNDDILKEFPDSQEAERVVTERWRKEHAFPNGGDKTALQTWYRANAAAAAEWYRRWHGMISLMQEFTAVAALDDTKPEDLLKLAQEYIRAYHDRPNSFYGAMPMEFDVSEALIRKAVLPATIPDWLDEGFRRETNRPSRLLGRPRDEMTDEQKQNADRQIDSMRIGRARILLDYYGAAGQNSKSRSVDDQLAGMNPFDDRLKPELFEVRAKAAEMDNRKLDALILYQSARALGGKPGLRGTTDSSRLDEEIARLFKDLGGTTPTLALFTGKTKLEPASVMRWETPKNPLPPFTLTDLGGKIWKLADLNGKATLINVWATWCGPCVAELPEFQKLYDQLKNRQDIALLTLNVDDKPGLVAPFMAEKRYTFPVLFGAELLASVSGDSGISIPQNWFLGPTTKLVWTQFGYGAEPQWPKVILERLEQLIKAK